LRIEVSFAVDADADATPRDKSTGAVEKITIRVRLLSSRQRRRNSQPVPIVRTSELSIAKDIACLHHPMTAFVFTFDVGVHAQADSKEHPAWNSQAQTIAQF
jgi:hypothetical protein